MGREVRRVAPDWEHPVTENGEYDPIYNAGMPKWVGGEDTHYRMYETTSPGTPISPPMPTPEGLAHWLVENKANAGLGQQASFEAWLRVCKGQPAFTAQLVRVRAALNGVEAAYQADRSRQRVDRLMQYRTERIGDDTTTRLHTRVVPKQEL